MSTFHRIFKRFRWVFHPITIFVVAQISWGLLVFVWIRWYVLRNQEIETFLRDLPPPVNLGSGHWVILTEGGVLMGIILLGLYFIFVALQKQKRLNRMQESILSSVTHELKTPIASIRLCNETMLMRKLSETDRDRFVKRVLGEVDRLQRLVDKVLMTAVLESGSAMPDYEKVDVIQSLEISWRRFAERVGSRRRLEHSVSRTGSAADGPGFFLDANPLQLEVVFDNLFENAFKYTDEGGHISLSVLSRPEELNLILTDDGCGIRRQELKSIFRKFYRAESSRPMRVKGSGLGLYTCHTILKSLGAEISASSEGVGKGASFHVTFHPQNSSR